MRNLGQEYNHQFYKNSIREHGISAQGVHWNSAFTQYKRFEIITSLIKEPFENITIVDAGCGFGEYFKYLVDNGKIPKEYIGIDCEEEMISLAKNRFTAPRFEVKNVLVDNLEYADYYVASGSLNILTEDEFALFIDKCFAKCTKAFIFNYLHKNSFNNVLTTEVIEFCEGYDCEVKFYNHYLSEDITFIMKKIKS